MISNIITYLLFGDVIFVLLEPRTSPVDVARHCSHNFHRTRQLRFSNLLLHPSLRRLDLQRPETATDAAQLYRFRAVTGTQHPVSGPVLRHREAIGIVTLVAVDLL